MFKLRERVLEANTNVKGVIVDIDDTLDKPYGVLFDDVDDDRGVWWCDSSMIKKDTESDCDATRQ